MRPPHAHVDGWVVARRNPARQRRQLSVADLLPAHRRVAEEDAEPLALVQQVRVAQLRDFRIASL
eukprot:9917886-Heterocapsa_arctica.AAC.1